jgi:DNA-binding HxlR family transcriptional regulator
MSRTFAQGRPVSPPLAARSGPSEAHGCRLGELLTMLGQPHTLEILHTFQAAGDTPVRFGELEKRLHLSPRTLSDRLRSLVEAGFLVRNAYREIPPRVEYRGTRKTAQLQEIFLALESWAKANSLTQVPMVASVGRIANRT